MTIPTFSKAGTGATDAGGAWSYTCHTPTAAEYFFIVAVVIDGTGSIVTVTSITNAEDLAGTDNVLTYVGDWNLGSPTAAHLRLWAGRSLSTSVPVITGANSGTDDVYVISYEFANVKTLALGGTSWATVAEGGTFNIFGTSNTASDSDVTTAGKDRLAVNVLGINDDNPFAGFTGQTGGTWTTRSSYAESTGTDGAIYLIDAPMAAIGTIGGGTGSITDSDAWGTAGFALIGTTSEFLPQISILMDGA